MTPEITLESEKKSGFRDTPLPFSGSAARPPREPVPERIRAMRRLYDYSRASAEARAENFVRQARFMADYEDDFPWQGSFLCYFPTYHDMSTEQLRGYFSWRSAVRRGEIRPIPVSAAYVYIFELLNGIGVSSPKEALEKMTSLEEGFADESADGARLRQNLRRWRLEYAVVSGADPETVRRFGDPELLRKDEALAVLRRPEDHTDEEIFEALDRLDEGRAALSPAVTAAPERTKPLFGEVWRRAAASYERDGKDLFTLCFGTLRPRGWYPLSNAVYRRPERPADREIVLNECRRYRCRGGVWEAFAYEKLFFDRELFRGLLRETDRQLRQYLKTGRYLAERAAEAWAAPYAAAVIEADRQAVLEALRPKIEIDLSGLEKIREDALVTRDSLLTEEDRMELAQAAEPEPETTGEEIPLPEPTTKDEIPLPAELVRILRALLDGDPPDEAVRAAHLTAPLAADQINDLLFDLFGDTVLACEDGRLTLIDDYTEELSQLMEGTET